MGLKPRQFCFVRCFSPKDQEAYLTIIWFVDGWQRFSLCNSTFVLSVETDVATSEIVMSANPQISCCFVKLSGSTNGTEKLNLMLTLLIGRAVVASTSSRLVAAGTSKLNADISNLLRSVSEVVESLRFECRRCNLRNRCPVTSEDWDYRSVSEDRQGWPVTLLIREREVAADVAAPQTFASFSATPRALGQALAEFANVSLQALAYAHVGVANAPQAKLSLTLLLFRNRSSSSRTRSRSEITVAGSTPTDWFDVCGSIFFYKMDLQYNYGWWNVPSPWNTGRPSSDFRPSQAQFP